MPVVVGLHHGAGLVLVLAPGEELAAELGEGGEAHGAEHAVDRHVAHPLVHVVATDPHVLERGGLDAVLLGWPADHGVEPDVGDLVAVVEPHVRAVVPADELGRLVLVLGGQQPVEHAPGLDDVVVDADQDHVFSAHSVLPFCTSARGEAPAFPDTDVTYLYAPAPAVGAKRVPGAPAGPGSPGSGRAAGGPGSRLGGVTVGRSAAEAVPRPARSTDRRLTVRRLLIEAAWVAAGRPPATGIELDVGGV